MQNTAEPCHTFLAYPRTHASALGVYRACSLTISVTGKQVRQVRQVRHLTPDSAATLLTHDAHVGLRSSTDPRIKAATAHPTRPSNQWFLPRSDRGFQSSTGPHGQPPQWNAAGGEVQHFNGGNKHEG
jgi:hypothetical protein